MTPIAEMGVHAKAGELALQRCIACGAAQYPPRELCWRCLGDALEWQARDREPGEVLATTALHHSHDVRFRLRLPLHVGLIRLDAGPTVVCFLADGCAAGTRVVLSADVDDANSPVMKATPAYGGARRG
jgi:uncharacterized OB-fold protein